MQYYFRTLFSSFISRSHEKASLLAVVEQEVDRTSPSVDSFIIRIRIKQNLLSKGAHQVLIVTMGPKDCMVIIFIDTNQFI